MGTNLRSFMGMVGAYLLPRSEPELKRTESLADSVQQARREWLSARAFFESVSEPELVDQAIYMVEAAERKYMYLLRKIRQERTAREA